MVDDREQLNLLKRLFDELVRNEAASSIDDCWMTQLGIVLLKR
jgi:hypothetical protein